MITETLRNSTNHVLARGGPSSSMTLQGKSQKDPRQLINLLIPRRRRGRPKKTWRRDREGEGERERERGRQRVLRELKD